MSPRPYISVIKSDYKTYRRKFSKEFFFKCFLVRYCGSDSYLLATHLQIALGEGNLGSENKLVACMSVKFATSSDPH